MARDMWRADVTSNRLRAPRAVRIRSVWTAFSRVVRERASTRSAAIASLSDRDVEVHGTAPPLAGTTGALPAR